MEGIPLETRIIDGWVCVEIDGINSWHKIEKNLYSEYSPDGLSYHEFVCTMRAYGCPVQEPLLPIATCLNCTGEE